MLRKRILGPDCSTEALVGSGPPTRLSSPGRASRGTWRGRIYQQQTCMGCASYKPTAPSNHLWKLAVPVTAQPPHDRGACSQCPQPLLCLGEREETVVGDRALHGRTHFCPQAGGLCFLPSSARSTGCPTPSHGPVNQNHPEVRAPGTPHHHPHGGLTEACPLPRPPWEAALPSVRPRPAPPTLFMVTMWLPEAGAAL